MYLQQFIIRHFHFFFLTWLLMLGVKAFFAEVMLRKHLVGLARLVQEVILRLINSALPSSSNGHPGVAAPEGNTVLPALLPLWRHALKSSHERLFSKYLCLPAICIICGFYKCFGYWENKVMYPVYIIHQNILRKSLTVKQNDSFHWGIGWHFSDLP